MALVRYIKWALGWFRLFQQHGVEVEGAGGESGILPTTFKIMSENKYPGLEREWVGTGYLYNIGTGTDMAVWTGEEGVERFYKMVEEAFSEPKKEQLSIIDRAKPYMHEFNKKMAGL